MNEDDQSRFEEHIRVFASQPNSDSINEQKVNFLSGEDCDRFVLKRENASFTARRLMILRTGSYRGLLIKRRIRNNKWSGSRSQE